MLHPTALARFYVRVTFAEEMHMATTTTAPRTDWRQEWFEMEDATYLNLAGQAPMPKVSIRAVQAALEAKKYPHQKPDSTFYEVPDRIRASIAKLIGAKPEEIALNSGASAAQWQLRHATWKPGDEVITAKGDSWNHPRGNNGGGRGGGGGTAAPRQDLFPRTT
jgi:selenocysteine lyase/cysteine desulfurase